jgi:hypothetical protein
MDFEPLLGVMAGDQWRPGIGDPTFLGWATVVAYLAAVLACWNAAAAEAKGTRRQGERYPSFWSGLGLILLLLGINKQLDLQSALTSFGRHLAREQGWYDRRRGPQVLLIIIVAGIGLAALGWLALRVRQASPGRRLAMMGLVFLIAFIIIRASSFHHVDVMLSLPLAGFKANWILELGGIGCVGLGARWSRRAARAEMTQRVGADADSDHMRYVLREIWKLPPR